MNTGRAFLAGVVGGAVMSAMMAVARAMGMEAKLELLLGTMLGIEPGPTAWIIGFGMHLVISGLIALLYALGFEYVTHRAGWLIGAAFAIIHILIGGVFMGMVPMMHPQVPGELSPPGAFMSNLGVMGVMAFVMLHLIYGAIVGTMYTVVHRHAGSPATAV